MTFRDNRESLVEGLSERIRKEYARELIAEALGNRSLASLFCLRRFDLKEALSHCFDYDEY